MRILLLSCLLLTSCGVAHRASGTVDHNVTTTSTVEVVLKVDLTGCMELLPEERLVCVLSVTDSLKELSSVAEVLLCARDLEAISGDESADTPISCRQFLPMENDGEGAGG